MKCPDQKLHCLLVQPEFPLGSFWNYKVTVELAGARTPNTPLGLITVAAILPQQWDFRLVDLNCRPLAEADWDWADLVCIGGMLPQQMSTLRIIREAGRRGKFVVVGGSDASSQPDVYAAADARVLDEGELTIPTWLESWRRGEPRGLFRSADKPDLTTSPVPRYDLLDIGDYGQVSLQISRGCPFNCEFCDIIELFGRKPRAKSPEQVVRELDAIRATGYSGCVDIVDDNFIGNKRHIRRAILPAMARWSAARRRPFYFVTEASMNLGDDVPMMREMVEAGFRIIFTGIETPDPKLLMQTQKTQNTMHPIQERLRRMMAAGLVPTAGFIFGFDNESPGIDLAMIRCIEDAPLVVAMIGLLVALPNTQLTRRLQREGRLHNFDGKSVATGSKAPTAEGSHSLFELGDQTVGGLNFETTRDRYEILREFRRAVAAIYEPKAYMDRMLRLMPLTPMRSSHIPRLWELRRNLRGLWRLCVRMTRDKRLRRLFWRNVLVSLRYGPGAIDMQMRMAALFLHFDTQRDHVLARTGAMLAAGAEEAPAAAPSAQAPTG